MKRPNEISKDLRTLSGLLDSWGKFVKNASSLCGLPINKINGTQIQYEVLRSAPLIFLDIDFERHSLPAGIEKIKKEDRLSEVKLTAFCTEKSSVDDGHDPFDELGINIAIELNFEDGNGDWKEHTCSWHLDKGAPTGSSFTHPLYHLNFGGDHMTKSDWAFGNLLLLTAPRIIHPPMDIVLACDFIVRNFYSLRNHQSLTSQPAYQTILAKAKARYWKSYSGTFISEWHSGLGDPNLSHQQLTGH
jgi:hypothetical protein